jgi:Putative zinc-finger
MRVLRAQTWACDRARQAVSLDLDGELSQLELAFLERHVRRCEPCAAFATELRGVSEQLRAAPLLPLARPIELPLRRRVGLSARRVGAWAGAGAAAAAALLAVMVLPAQQRVHRIGPTPTPVIVQSNNDDLRDLRVLRQAQMMPTALTLARTSPRGPEL